MVRVSIYYYGENGYRDFDTFEEAKAYVEDCRGTTTVAYFTYNGIQYSSRA